MNSWLSWQVGYNPVRLRTRVRISGSALIGREDNLTYVGNTPTPWVRISRFPIGWITGQWLTKKNIAKRQRPWQIHL